MKICPYCEQSNVARVRLKSMPSVVFQMCYECDSVWDNTLIISDQNGTNFKSFMFNLGTKPNWEDIVFIEEI
jgi:hypothetical protein